MEIPFIKAIDKSELQPIPKWLICEDANGDQYVVHCRSPKVILRIYDFSVEASTKEEPINLDGMGDYFDLDFEVDPYIEIDGKWSKIDESRLTKSINDLIDEGTAYFENIVEYQDQT